MAKKTEAEQISAALAALPSAIPPPPVIKGLMFDLGNDEAGDAAVFVTVFLADDTPDSDWVSQKLEPIASIVRDAVRSSGADRWPYVDFARWEEAAQIGNFDPHARVWKRVG